MLYMRKRVFNILTKPLLTALCLSALVGCSSVVDDENEVVGVPSNTSTFINLTIGISNGRDVDTRAGEVPAAGENGDGREAGFLRENAVTGNNDNVTGNSNTVNGNNDNVNGNGNKVEGNTTNVYGNDNNSTGDNNDIYGNTNTVDGNSNNVVGKNNQVNGNYDNVHGNTNIINGDTINVFGNENTSTGENINNYGNGNNVEGVKSNAYGNGNQLTADDAGSFGNDNTVTGEGSYAIGNRNEVSGDHTFVYGSDIKATGSNSIVLGADSDGSQDNVLSIGAEGKERKIVHVADGTIAENSKDAVNAGQLYDLRENATGVNVDNWAAKLGTGKIEAGNTGLVSGDTVFEAIKDITVADSRFVGVNNEDKDDPNYRGGGAIGDNAIAIGPSAKAEGEKAIALGVGAEASGVQSISIGTGNQVTGNHSGAFGDPNIVSGAGSYAFGNNNNVSGDNTFVVGNDVTATGKNSVVLGAGSDGSQDNVVSVGAAGAERRIVHVADGRVAPGSSDAVTGNQLYNVKAQLENNTEKATAGAVALASLTPPAFDGDEKFAFGAAVGNYKSETAAAVGMFYRPKDNIMINVRGTIGNGDNMVGGGVSFALNRPGVPSISKSQMVKVINAQAQQIQQMANEMGNMKQQLNAMQINPALKAGFKDVPTAHWAGEAVATLHGNGYLDGYPDGTFKGDRPMTRYEYAELLYNALCKGSGIKREHLREYKAELKQVQAARQKAGQQTVDIDAYLADQRMQAAGQAYNARQQ